MKKKTVFLILITLIVLFIIGTVFAIFYTERSDFCNVCHNMKPYYKAWKESPHKDVACVECHYEPNLKSFIKGKKDGLIQVFDYITGRYSERSVAKVSDASCLRSGCHNKETLLNKKIMFKNKVEYSHASHWKDHDELGKGIRLRCATCHMWLTYETHIAVDENTCFICHFKNVPVEKISTQCLTCHTEIKNNAEHKEYSQQGTACTECHTTIKTTNAPVLKQMCYFCHADKDKIEKVKDRELLHQRHIPQNNADCINCHELIQHGRED